jgi:hypothetical protein
VTDGVSEMQQLKTISVATRGRISLREVHGYRCQDTFRTCRDEGRLLLNRRLLSGVSLAVLASAVVANAAAMPVRVPHDEGAAVKAPDPPPPPAPYNWTGFYTGLNVGTAWGSFDPNTASTGGTYFPNPPDVAAINAAGRLSIKPLGFVWGAARIIETPG